MILNKSITPSEGEVSVKSYQCSSFNSILLGIKAKGYLEVTNKRLLFQASSIVTSRNKSVIHNEIPISEVVGISVYSGKAFNWLRLLAGILLLTLIISVSSAIISSILSFLDDSPKIYQTLLWLLFIGSLYLAYLNRDIVPEEGEVISSKDGEKDKSLKELAIMGLGLGMLGAIIKDSMNYFNQLGSVKFAVPVFAIVALYTLYRYSRKPAFSLSIFSKSSANAIVEIAAPSPLPFQGKSGSPTSKALTGKPDRDSLLVLQELGAVILDIQNLGEYGIEKWKKQKL